MTKEQLDALAEDGFGHYLAGFIDGEGCFQIKRQYAKGTAGRVNYNAVFLLSVRSDDRAVLEECCRRTGLGRVRSYRSRNPRHGGQAQWAVNSNADTHELVEILDRFPLRAKKARDYEIWREAVRERGRMMAAGRMWRRDWSRMEELFNAIRDERRFRYEATLPAPCGPYPSAIQ